MAKDTPSMAKNRIRRSLLAILDPHPSEREVGELWNYFASACAYCAKPIERDSRTGHLDHLISSALGGGNSIHNNVLACSRCNGDEKRESEWQAFVVQKSPTAQAAEERTNHIQNWISQGKPSAIEAQTAIEAESIIQSALLSYDEAVRQMRLLRKRGDA